jgi:hypothetical protein
MGILPKTSLAQPTGARKTPHDRRRDFFNDVDRVAAVELPPVSEFTQFQDEASEGPGCCERSRAKAAPKGLAIVANK